MIAKPSDIKPAQAFGWRGLVERAWNAGRSALGYDAVEVQDRRRLAAATLKSEDMELDATKRRLMVAQSRDVARNFALASWAVRKHLDFVSRFTFSSNTKTDFDKRFEELVEEASQPGACEVTGHMSHAQLTRTIEARSVGDGDCLIVRMNDGRVQLITGDRIRNSVGWGAVDGDVYHGVRVNKVGAAQSFAIHRRLRWGGFEFEREVPVENVFFHAYREGTDQVRGITPLAAGLNAMQDVYEGFDYALQKAKISQLFGLVFYRDGTTQAETLAQSDEVAEAVDGGDAEAESRYSVDLRGGPFKLELEGTDRAEWLESKTPSTETMELLKTMIGVSLKSLDIPLCFYDEGLTNFFGQRAALILYLESCKTKRENLRTNWLHPWTRWKLQRWVLEGKLVLPAGATIDKVPFTWQPAGCPYWNPSQEVNADVQAIKAGLANFEDIYRERTGRDWFADMDRLAEQYKHLAKLGLPIDPQLVPIVMAPTQQGTDNAFQAALAALSV